MEYVSLIISCITILFTLYSYRTNVIHDRKIATLDSFNTLQNEVLDSINRYSPKQVEEIAQHPRSEEYKALSCLLARLEHFSVGVNSKIYDQNTVQRLTGVYFISIFNKMKPMIAKKRKIRTNEKHYDEFEKLVLSIGKQYPDENVTEIE